ncbi:STAS/SEC14 domain-containing protein [Colwellia sp. D2M02]|uniref:STAS/SEC14 domain-containing protein n=1 Tax=Colwellia sp. D2M02 TaxID=2841562 RepID=UPI001C08C563|nr:STAS/SEC14 domain-containing protein [Colwellia sp. D2M02]MBU2893364.1 STAS/SEC14 domain-containing protein [Colwellia sp. D2M02]
MITILEQSEGANIGVFVSGKVDAAEENKWIAIFDKLIADHGEINMLIVIDDNISFTLEAAYDDFKWALKNIKHMHNLAIVSNSKTLAWLIAVDSPFGKLVGVNEKHFETSELAQAWHWVTS